MDCASPARLHAVRPDYGHCASQICASDAAIVPLFRWYCNGHGGTRPELAIANNWRQAQARHVLVLESARIVCMLSSGGTAH
jgi:hypothetical protein